MTLKHVSTVASNVTSVCSNRTKSIDNRLSQVEDIMSKRKYKELLVVLNVFFWIVILDAIAILYLLL